MNYKNFFWVVPFVSFWLGYQLFNFIVVPREIVVPDVMGKHISDVLCILSSHQLNARIVTQKEDLDMPEGIVLGQQPKPGQKVRSQASLFLVTSKKPPLPKVPQLAGLSASDRANILSKQQLRAKTYYLSSLLPEGVCIGQIPKVQSPIHDNKLVVYVSVGDAQPLLFPRLIGLNIKDVKEFLVQHNLKTLRIMHAGIVPDNHLCKTCIVLEQKPLTGSLIDPQNPPVVYLKVVLRS